MVGGFVTPPPPFRAFSGHRSLRIYICDFICCSFPVVVFEWMVRCVAWSHSKILVVPQTEVPGAHACLQVFVLFMFCMLVCSDASVFLLCARHVRICAAYNNTAGTVGKLWGGYKQRVLGGGGGVSRNVKK